MFILILTDSYIHQIKAILHSFRNYWQRNMLFASYKHSYISLDTDFSK